ncbi:MAG: hypothetical protein QM665_00510 [Desulfovibrio sp.]
MGSRKRLLAITHRSRCVSHVFSAAGAARVFVGVIFCIEFFYIGSRDKKVMILVVDEHDVLIFLAIGWKNDENYRQAFL